MLMYFCVQVSEETGVIFNQTCIGKFVQYLINAEQVALSHFGSTTLVRHDKPLVVRGTFDQRMKRITFTSSRDCYYDLLRERERCMNSSSDDGQKPNRFHRLSNTLQSQRHHPRFATEVTTER